MSETPYERREAEQAASEAAAIGGQLRDGGEGAGDGKVDPARRPVVEAGGGEAEGFEQAESALIAHASHGDQQSAHTVLHDQGRSEERADWRENGEADHEHTSERPGDEHG